MKHRLIGVRIGCSLAISLAVLPVAARAQTPLCPTRAAGSVADAVRELRQCLALLEEQIEAERRRGVETSVDLTDHEQPTLEADAPTPASTVNLPAPDAVQRPDPVRAAADSRPWYRNFSLSGFGAVEYVDSGDQGTKPFGGFAIRESSLFVESTVWQDVSLFIEMQVNRLGKDHELFMRTGEMHVVWRNLMSRWGTGALNVKVGRVDIPFGEDYLWQDAIDNPLISFAAAYPYGWDEGIVAFGTTKGFGWIAAVSDGTDDRSIEENASKAVNTKVFGRPWPGVYLSASAMWTGRTSESAIEFGGSHLEPVGVGRPSAVGVSPSQDITARLAQVDASLRPAGRVRVKASFGQAGLDDAADAFDRTLTWFSIEPRVDLTPKTYAIARYSEIGTYDSLRGYHFDGKTTAGGHAFGYDVKRLQRFSAGFGLRPNPRVLVKAEVGHDWFHLIRDSRFSTNRNRRLLTAATLVVSF